MAEDKETGDDKEHSEEEHSEKSGVEGRLSKLEKTLSETLKALEDERKNSAGRDKKIAELTEEKKELQKATYSKDQLLEIRQKELDEAKSEWEQQRAQEKIELERLKVEQLKNQVLSKLENFPNFLIDRIRGQTAEEIETDARQIMNKWVKERDKVTNTGKVTGRPKSGNGKQISISAEEVDKMTSKEKLEWAKKATDEEYNAIFDELHSG